MTIPRDAVADMDMVCARIAGQAHACPECWRMSYVRQGGDAANCFPSLILRRVS